MTDTNAPERIWIDEHGGNWSDRDGGTQRLPYVRADLFAALEAQIAAPRDAGYVAGWSDAQKRAAQAGSEACEKRGQIDIARDVEARIMALSQPSAVTALSLADHVKAYVDKTQPPLVTEWTPPTEAERPDGYRCRIMLDVMWVKQKYNAHWVTTDENRTLYEIDANAPNAFAPLPGVQDE